MSGLQPGDVIDGFTVGEKLHAGGQGVIYACAPPPDRPDLDFPLLIKVPRLGPGEPSETVVTYEVEQTVHAAVVGPHLPRFVASGDLARQPYLVMERIEGQSLKDWAERAPLPAEEVAALGAAIATAVHALHAQEVVHLDLKPANVIIRPDGTAVLVDLGLARHAHFPDLLAEEFRHPMGSGPYISPEQVLGVRWDPRSDLFALGVILYQLSTGEYPHGAPTTQAGLRRRLWHMPASPRKLRPDLPEWLQEVTLRCLEAQAAQRYASAAQVASDLTHPEQVTVGERGRRLRRPGLGTLLKRWIMAAGYEPSPLDRPSQHLVSASIVLAAVATQHKNEQRFQALREVVQRLMAVDGDRRLTCVSVIHPASEFGGGREEDSGTSLRIRHLVLLRHWAEPLGLPPERLSYHVIESSDPAAALLEYAKVNQVEHLVIGAPPSDVPLKGTFVSTRVAAEAGCSVTVVRPRAAG
ncbi:MAG: protein kinase [Anaeromyxobacter sp.]|nr:protein kinase [Anaeromyxobacter sp.]MBL0275707.1 protein kinase [Anaeromyxobacter sp.]